MQASVVADFELKVSVCVVTYNQEKYVQQCLQSIVDQRTNYKFDVIVCDDCSSDGTRAIIKAFADKYPSIVKPVFHEKNIGAYNNFIYAHQQATGRYVAHVDGDDLCLPGKLQCQADLLDSMLACTAVWHRVDYFNDQGEECSGYYANLAAFPGGRVNFGQAIRFGFVGVHSSLMYRKSAQGPGPTDSDMLDLFRTWDLLSKGDGYILDQVLGKYRIGANGSITVKSLSRIRRLSIAHAKYFLSRFPERKNDFFVFFIIGFLVDLKNLRPTAFDFLISAMRTVSYISPREFFGTIQKFKEIQVPWSRRKRMSGLNK